jgi:hypothetical protein
MLTGTHFYNQTLKKSVSVFGTIFNNIRIVKHGGVEERVPISYGPRQKFLARLEQSSSRDEHIAIKVPRMSFEITDLSYDSSISLNKMNKTYHSSSDSFISRDSLSQSVPYTLSIELNIISKTQDEALQIVEQILPTFTPEYTVGITNMNGPDKTVDVPIILNSVSIPNEYEGDFESRGTIIYTLSFTMKVRFIGPIAPKAIIRDVSTNLFGDIKEDGEQTPIGRVKTELGSSSDTPFDFTTITTFGFDDDSP